MGENNTPTAFSLNECECMLKKYVTIFLYVTILLSKHNIAPDYSLIIMAELCKEWKLHYLREIFKLLEDS